jgi:hypothetical protein
MPSGASKRPRQPLQPAGWSRYSGGLTAAAVVTIMLGLAGPACTASMLAALALFTVPGILLWRLAELGAGSPAPLVERLAIGAALGIGLSTTLSILCSWLWGFSPSKLALVLVALSAALFAVGRLVPTLHASAPDEATDVGGLACVFIVAASVALIAPYAAFARRTSEGVAFSTLQKTDLLHHMVTVAEVSRGIPPANPYFSGETLHYFWWAHVLPAFAWGLSGYRSSPRDVIVLAALAYSVVTVLAVSAAFRAMYSDRRVLWVLMTLTVLAPGYTDLFVLARWLMQSLPGGGPAIVQRLFTDDWGGAYTGYSHGFFRSFLVEPHNTLALAMVAVLMALGARYGFSSAPARVALVQGALLGWSLATDTFVGMLVAATWAIGGAVELLRGSGRRPRVLGSLAASALAAAPVLALMLLLRMVVPGERTLVVKPYLTMLLLSPVYFIADYGPLAVLGAAGLIGWFRDRREADETIRFLAVLTAVCLVAMFFVSHVQVGTQVFRKAGLLLRLPLAALAGWAVARILDARQPWLRRALAISVIVAIPTLVTDVARITGRGPVPDHVYVVSPEDVSAYDWMKEHLPSAALVQELPGEVPGVVALAQRRTALGDWVHAANYQIGEQRVGDRHRDIYRVLFLGPDAGRARDVAAKYGIEYVFVGREAREKATAAAIQKFERCPATFEPVYRQGGVVVYRVDLTATPGPGC